MPVAGGGEPDTVLFAGRMTPLKGGHVLIAAAARASRLMGRPVHLVMAGDGPQKDAWRRLAASLGVRLELTGWVNLHDRARVYSRGLFVAVPSLWPEPFGLVGLDAASLGRPAIAFDVGGISDWLTDRVNGRLVEPGAGSEGLAQAMCALLNDSGARERMGQCALEVAAAHVGRDARRAPRVHSSGRRVSESGVGDPGGSMTHWTILTCEYPPGCGGVGDYTAQVAAALAEAGDTVTVFCPPRAAPAPRDLGDVVEPPGVEVVMLDDAYGSIGRRTIDQRLGDQRLAGVPSTILVQYVPTGFGLRGANIPWCRWLLERRRRHGDDVRVMFHEPYFEFTWSPIRQNALAVAERLMARMLLRAASRVYLSTEAWRRYLAPHTAGHGPQGFVTLPIPSAIPRCDRPAAVVERRKQLLGSSARQLVGHFGTFGSEVAPMLTAALTNLMEHGAGIRAVCVGSGSDAFVRSLDDAAPTIRGRVHRNRTTYRLATRPWSSVRATCSCNPTRTASRQDGHRPWRGWSTPARS